MRVIHSVLDFSNVRSIETGDTDDSTLGIRNSSTLQLHVTAVGYQCFTKSCDHPLPHGDRIATGRLSVKGRKYTYGITTAPAQIRKYSRRCEYLAKRASFYSSTAINFQNQTLHQSMLVEVRAGKEWNDVCGIEGVDPSEIRKWIISKLLFHSGQSRANPAKTAAR